eukprot:m.876855 g.876855  ORF g.876855 m.876855 type:complete len:219 (-) comp23580_c0_seq23:4438-5094(-)
MRYDFEQCAVQSRGTYCTAVRVTLSCVDSIHNVMNVSYFSFVLHRKGSVWETLREVDFRLSRRARIGITAVGLTRLFAAASHLDVVKLHRCVQVDDSVFRTISATCPRLRHLELGACDAITDEAVAGIAQLKNLVSLGLNETQLTDEGCAFLARGCSKQSLRELNVSKCRVTDTGLCEIIASCPGLVTLLFGGCHGVTSQTRNRLRPARHGYHAWTVY